MDYVPSTAAIAAAAQKTPHADPTVAATKLVTPTAQAALDPRPTYTLSPVTADAMLSLARTRVEAVAAADFDTRYGHTSRITEAATAAVSAPVVAPEPAKTVSAANRNWTEDVRLDHIPTRKVGEDTIVQYDHPQVSAIWSAAFPNVTGRKYRGLLLGDKNRKPDVDRLKAESGLTLREKDIYLLCNSDYYKIFSQDHPDTHINWIAVDSEDILFLWPKDKGGEREDASGAAMSVLAPPDPEA